MGRIESQHLTKATCQLLLNAATEGSKTDTTLGEICVQSRRILNNTLKQAFVMQQYYLQLL